jgi:glycosyltransferase involved in cell wall biosynthesis
MRVLIVIAEMGTGGAERLVAELARGLAEQGDEVAIAAEPGPSDRHLAGSQVARYPLSGRGRSPLRVLRSAYQASRAASSFHPDVVHVHNVKATAIVAAGRLGRRGAPPLVTTFHGVPPGEYRRAALVLRAARLVACVSQDLVDRLVRHRFPAARLRVVANAVPIPGPLGAAKREAIDAELGLTERPVVSIVGRLVAQKAHQRFVEAARLVAAELPGCRFVIVGDGPRRAELEALVDRRGLGESVRFTGEREDARELIARSDAIVFSSDWEGMPMVALEALAAGVPVVSTDVEGMRQLLADDAGIVVPRTADALADAVVSLLRSQDRGRRMGEVGRSRVRDRHSVETMVTAYRSLYEELLDGVR